MVLRKKSGKNRTTPSRTKRLSSSDHQFASVQHSKLGRGIFTQDLRPFLDHALDTKTPSRSTKTNRKIDNRKKSLRKRFADKPLHAPTPPKPKAPHARSSPKQAAPRETDHLQIDRYGPSPSPSLPPQASPGPRNRDPVVYSEVIYTHGKDDALIQVALLEEIWEIQWENPVQLKWTRDWSEVCCDIQVEIQQVRFDPSGTMAWICGDLQITGIGTEPNGSHLLHETLFLPFSATLLSPSTKKPVSDSACVLPVPPPDRWAEAGDWKAKLIPLPLREPCNGYDERLALITGRVWWFRKQFIKTTPPTTD